MILDGSNPPVIERRRNWTDVSGGRRIQGVEETPEGPQFRRVVTVLAQPASRPWRRYLRFSVRGLIVLVLVIGVWLGWIVRSARIQREAVAAIEKAGGIASYYDWEWTTGGIIPGRKPWAPRWLVDLIGVDYFGHVTTVAVLLVLNAIRRSVRTGRASHSTEQLYLVGTSLSDSGCTSARADQPSAARPLLYAGHRHRVSASEGLTNLSLLRLDNTRVTNAGLAHLKGLTNLSLLDLNGTQVTDAGLAHLKGLTNLSDLDLSGTQVTDAGLVHLKGLTNSPTSTSTALRSPTPGWPI